MLKVKLIDKTLPEITKATPRSIGYDLYARHDLIIPYGSSVLIPLNVVMSPPEGMGILLFARSSLFKKHGLIVTNGVGVIDPDYSGENDEIKLSVYRLTPGNAYIQQGERVAQAVLVPVADVEMQYVLTMGENDRGGFGSSG